MVFKNTPKFSRMFDLPLVENIIWRSCERLLEIQLFNSSNFSMKSYKHQSRFKQKYVEKYTSQITSEQKRRFEIVFQTDDFWQKPFIHNVLITVPPCTGARMNAYLLVKWLG